MCQYAGEMGNSYDGISLGIQFGRHFKKKTYINEDSGLGRSVKNKLQFGKNNISLLNDR